MRVVFLLTIAIAFALVFAFSVSPKKEQVIAVFATKLEGRLPSQRANAIVALTRLDGTVIPPGGVFSFNKTLGSWSRDRGYFKAPVSYNGMLIRSWGGGVCQASTTLYNAALVAGLEIVERHSHHFAPKYVPPGRDAAVAYENIDLKFRNPFKYPITIRGEEANGLARVQLIASAHEQSRCRVYQEVKAHTAPSVVAIHTGSRANRIRNSGLEGWQVTVWRIRDGKRELISSDSYPAMQKIVEVN